MNNTKKKFIPLLPKKSSPIISFRDEVGRTMHAAFYDHYTIRKITDQPTSVTVSSAINEHEIKEKWAKFTDYIEDEHNKNTLGLSHEEDQRVVPSVVTEAAIEGGLLIIPGQRRFPKPGEHAEERNEHEKQLIKEALRRGQPILAICGGSRKLWGAFGGDIIPVDGHVSPSMPTLLDNGSVGNNPQIHDITLMDGTILKACMKAKTAKVNSIHWAAPLENEQVLQQLEVSALSQESQEAEATACTSDTIEAFENKFGAPVIGIQWHPEAYYKHSYDNETDRIESERHLNIIRYMAQSGDAYQAKQKMLREMKTKISSLLGNSLSSITNEHPASSNSDVSSSEKMHSPAAKK